MLACDQVCLTVLCEQAHNLGLCTPYKWVGDLEGVTQYVICEVRHLTQSARVRRPSRAAADDLRCDRQIEAHDPVLEKADPRAAHHLGDNASDG